MTHEELRENRRLLQIEAKYVRLEKLFIDMMLHFQEYCGKMEEVDKYLKELLK
ncbi:hypothetical protein LCGC14_2084920 [marine sediment metagenome]|uniref:Uncharacterized protein n=1 Tax=marine sediment metagenome TaxID=412755 RepID=A0A0F9EEC4_9ZZZZ